MADEKTIQNIQDLSPVGKNELEQFKNMRWARQLNDLLDKIGWIVDPHGKWNSSPTALKCKCKAGEEYIRTKTELFKFIDNIIKSHE